LLTREEMAKALDVGAYYRVPPDARDLNYSQYFSEGEPGVSVAEEYNSHNTQQLDLGGMIELLLTLECVRDSPLRHRGHREVHA
jgi:UDP-glucose 4-epimerase